MKKYLLPMVAFVPLCMSLGASAQQFKEYDILRGSQSSVPKIEAVLNNQLIMTAFDSTGDRELWVSDGTLNGTHLIRDINPNGGSNPHSFAQANGKLFFVADDGITSNGLWVTDGSDSGTLKLYSFTGDSATISSYLMSSYAAFNNMLYFTAFDSTTGVELWVTDGSTTMLLKDIMPGLGSGSFPTNLTATSNNLYFTATDLTHGNEVWVSDGTFFGTHMVKDIWPGITGAGGSEYIEYNGLVYFRAIDATHGSELWVTNGTGGGTQLLSDIMPGFISSVPTPIGVMNGELFFSVNNSAYGASLWKTDGTPSGTIFVTNAINAGNPSFTILGNSMYFSGSDPAGIEPWITDGTNGGTHMLKDVNNGIMNSDPAGFTASGGHVYFTATDSAGGTELFVTDGTDAGTVMLKDIYPGTGGSYPLYLLPYNNKLLFSAGTNIADRKLYLSNGTSQGTILKTPPGCDNATDPLSTNYFTGFYMLGNKVFFTASYTANGIELWSFTDPQVFHVANTDDAISCRMYPNPATDAVRFDIAAKANERLNIIISDITGRMVYQTGYNQYNNARSTTTIPVAQLAIGTYIYRVVNSTGAVYTAGKLVKQ